MQKGDTKIEVLNTSTTSYEFDRDKLLGEGTFGRVFLGTDKNTDEKVAIKEFRKGNNSEGISFTACREIALLKELDHPNIVALKDVVVDPTENSFHLIFEHAEFDLIQILRQHREWLTRQVIKSFLWQILNGMNYLHLNWTLHRDLKPSNLLVMGAPNKGTIKIADFGLARIFQAPLRTLADNGVVVTIWYRAPELLLGSGHYTHAIDMWAVGCIFYELFKKKPLFPGREPTNQRDFQEDQLSKIFSILGVVDQATWKDATETKYYSKIKDVKFKKDVDWEIGLDAEMGTTGLNLLKRMLDYDPTKRVTAGQALAHDYFKEPPLPINNPLMNIP